MSRLPEPPATRVPQITKRWYGTSILIADGVSLGLGLLGLGIFVGGSMEGPSAPYGLGLLVISVAGFHLNGAIMHIVQGEPLRALPSFGLRLVSGLVLGASGLGLSVLSSGRYDSRTRGEIAVAGTGAGFMLGFLLASFLDSWLLARQVQVAPLVACGAWGLAVSGQF